MSHVTVLLNEAVDGLAVAPGKLYCDCTLGFAGHSELILRRGGRLIAIDRDADAIAASRERLAEYGGAVTFVHGNFGDIAEILKSLGIEKLDGGLLADCGVSSWQLDAEGARGFSYMRSEGLDMRMNRDENFTARELVNTWSAAEIKRILYEYGEERYAPQIAAAIARRREIRPIETTEELADIIRSAMPGKALREKQHPAKRSFQAIRQAVNNEPGELNALLAALPEVLESGARACFIEFHSGEGSAIKRAFKNFSDGCTCPKDFPKCVCGFVPSMKIITKKPILPSAEEISDNPRSRSAKLRIAERL
ncbi:MAG: 16S rRNA (cytosine(1402)-N(4))-methyltransferase RsmH [Oscillospiraceae bacterium]|jgi:16S rRNA (cytosine1402-N4)-methyltransferase|nr:16S rRNA (cytosine(1402)-N(4))-methyltransferase RsmH [Oscillospiraceae bacterium]